MNQQNTLSLQALNSLDSKESEQWFSQCCAAPKWFKGMSQARPFTDFDTVLQAAKDIWQQCSTAEFLIAFDLNLSKMVGNRGFLHW